MERKKIKDNLKFLYFFFKRPALFTSRKKYLFVLSHMRSYSTLLAHILGSNKEISGYSEIHQSYCRWYDLMRLKQKVYRANDDQLGGHFILDKILHNRFIISDTVLNRNDVQIIFILRNPEDTAKSIINMGSRLRTYP